MNGWQAGWFELLAKIICMCDMLRRYESLVAYIGFRSLGKNKDDDEEDEVCTVFIELLALSIFITRDVITHCYSSRNKSVPYV